MGFPACDRRLIFGATRVYTPPLRWTCHDKVFGWKVVPRMSTRTSGGVGVEEYCLSPRSAGLIVTSSNPKKVSVLFVEVCRAGVSLGTNFRSPAAAASSTSDVVNID